MSTCYCIGPQNGEPLCPCRMKDLGVVNKNGRWIQPEIDLGKAPQDLESEKDGEHSSNYYENMGEFL